MSYSDHDDQIRNMIRRATLLSLDAGSGDHLTGKFSAMKGQEMGEVVLSHNFGFHSEPMAGASAILMRMGGAAEAMHALGFDDPRYRPKNLGPGSAALYDATGNIVSLVQKNIRMVSPQKVEIIADNLTWNGRQVRTV